MVGEDRDSRDSLMPVRPAPNHLPRQLRCLLRQLLLFRDNSQRFRRHLVRGSALLAGSLDGLILDTTGKPRQSREVYNSSTLRTATKQIGDFGRLPDFGSLQIQDHGTMEVLRPGGLRHPPTPSALLWLPVLCALFRPSTFAIKWMHRPF